MNFLRGNIDRAIVMTQYDLRGFAHPLGFREEFMSSPKSLEATTANFMGFAVGHGNGQETDERYAKYFDSSFEEYLAMCRRLYQDCDLSEREAIQLIVKEIVRQAEEMRAEVASGKREPSAYLKPLDKDNRWGRAVLALAEAFEVNLQQLAA